MAVPVTRLDGEPEPHNASAGASESLFIGKYAEKFTLFDAHPLLGGFSEAFSLTAEICLGQGIPPTFRAPEANFQSQRPLTYPSGIRCLVTAVWEIIGIKVIFSTGFARENKIVSGHIDILSATSLRPWQCWE